MNMLKVQNNFDPCWILTTGRTGSSFLMDCLNIAFNRSEKSGRLEYFAEWFGHWHPRYESLPRFAKVMRWHYTDRFFDEDKSFVELNLPKIRYILLRRRDVLAQTVSMYFAIRTNDWNTKDLNLFKKNPKYPLMKLIF